MVFVGECARVREGWLLKEEGKKAERALLYKLPQLLMRRLILRALAAYKAYISCVLPKSCRFWPTCSCYAYESIERYGALKGGLKTLWRIIRCQPFSAGGYDPVK